MSGEAVLAGLDPQQRKAAAAEFNAVVAAGAGSGKTRVLASRYAWLIMEKGYKVDQILALTFTNKAVTEMYSRIYDLLVCQNDERAREAVADFYKAKISTLDSFCAMAARTAARHYGISPDFKCDDAAVRDLALEASLPFVLSYRDNPSLQVLLADRKIRTVAEELFAETALRYSPISRPLDFDRFIKVQGEEICRQWEAETKKAADLIGLIRSSWAGLPQAKFYESLGALLRVPLPPAPGIDGLLQDGGGAGSGETGPESVLRKQFVRYFEYLFAIKGLSHSDARSGHYREVKDHLNELRDLYGDLETIANTALHWDIIRSVFPLMDEFQTLCNRLKREAGLLTFNDVAHLAVDALIKYPDIRKVYKDQFRAVMIDEFQDNNRLQRDLIFLLAEKPGRDKPELPGPQDLSPDKMFFVGDEKQSIYRFRGADVSVFRELADSFRGAAGSGESAAGDIPSDDGTLNLIYNYRSRPGMIAAFNLIFGGVPVSCTFKGSPADTGGSANGTAGAESGETGRAVFCRTGKTADNFEARYFPVYPQPGTDPAAAGTENVPVHFCFLDKGRLEKDGPSSYDIEAAYIADRIRTMVEGGFSVQVREKGELISRPCVYGDFAVLQRSTTHQHNLEKQFKDFGVPYNADRPAGLFSDAPVNDLYNLLRLLIYPGDRLAYAALIRSPFMRLSDLTLSVCMLHEDLPPFDEFLEPLIPEEERECFRRGRERYNALAADSRSMPVAALLTRLWYNEGYRYETIWSADSQIYGGLFDLFFELARTIDARGKTLADFIDYTEELINKEKPPDLSVTGEREPGVRIMTIHKSKGLEFPVVFVYCCAGKMPRANTRGVYFSGRWGITLNLPQAEELSESRGNYFFNLQRDEENRKEIAELRRLLYVAMTRAESALFLTMTLPAQTEKEKKDQDPEQRQYTKEFIAGRLYQLDNREDKKISGFLDLLVPVLAGCESPPYSIDLIEFLEWAGIDKRARRHLGPSMAAAVRAAVPLYEGAEIITAPAAAISAVNASSLRYLGPASGSGGAAAECAGTESAQAEFDFSGGGAGGISDVAGESPGGGRQEQVGDDLDRFLAKAGLDAAGFGTVVHRFIEARFEEQPPRIPPRITAKLDEEYILPVYARALAMADRFFKSELGRLSLGASYREPEYPILTIVKAAGRDISVTGQIDLIFETEGTVHVVDFKTDREEKPAEHYGQLAVYKRAAADIFGKPVRCWLFYLRSGRPEELTGSLDLVNIEEIAGACAGPIQ
ncbi:MAG: UvrD-helicase domain-containing protein [Treponema sp.]|jgi:ATP-dependent helicase/nuclease subunit A|nr:UvrD-helicase domain-containing protein [Treponema sp.]